MKSALVFLFLPLALCAAAPSGEAVYQKRCAACHDSKNDRIPPRESLQKFPATHIVRALDTGAMMAIGFTLSRDERIAVASYLGTNEKIEGPAASAFCVNRAVKLSANPVGWNGWSPGSANARFQSAEAAGLSIDGVRKLKLKWAFGFDGDVTSFAAPTVLDGHLFVGSAAGVVHAMNASTGCLEWTFQANASVRSAIAVAQVANGRHALLFGDMIGWFYAVEAETGKLLWKQHVETHDSTRLTGAATVYNGVVYVPVASWEETRSGDLDYTCCTFRGSVVALQIRDGKQLWKSYMVDEPKETGKNPRGVAILGPSGVGVWSSPTLDAKRGLLYVTTGDNYSAPATELSDSIVALNLKTGAVVWSKQMTPGDVYSGACSSMKEGCGPDFDFGSSVIPVTLPDGRELLLAGQKSGVVYAVDPNKKGEIVWQTRVGVGGTNGGVQWGMSTDGQFVYASVSDPGRSRQTSMTDTRRYVLDPKKGGGLTALRVADGSKLWYTPAAPCPEGAPVGCSPSQPGALTGIPGVIFSGSVDGHIRGFSAEDGSVLWDFNTAHEFQTINGVKAFGGSLDGAGPVVVNGMVYVNSGYPRNGGMSGNVLLAFGAE